MKRRPYDSGDLGIIAPVLVFIVIMVALLFST